MGFGVGQGRRNWRTPLHEVRELVSVLILKLLFLHTLDCLVLSLAFPQPQQSLLRTALAGR